IKPLLRFQVVGRNGLEVGDDHETNVVTYDDIAFLQGLQLSSDILAGRYRAEVKLFLQTDIVAGRHVTAVVAVTQPRDRALGKAISVEETKDKLVGIQVGTGPLQGFNNACLTDCHAFLALYVA